MVRFSKWVYLQTWPTFKTRENSGTTGWIFFFFLAAYKETLPSRGGARCWFAVLLLSVVVDLTLCTLYVWTIWYEMISTTTCSSNLWWDSILNVTTLLQRRDWCWMENDVIHFFKKCVVEDNANTLWQSLRIESMRLVDVNLNLKNTKNDSIFCTFGNLWTSLFLQKISNHSSQHLAVKLDW